MIDVKNGKIDSALHRLERDKNAKAVWHAMETIDELTDTYATLERRRLCEDAHDLIADLVYVNDADPEWDDIVQDRVDAARFVLRGRVEA